MSNYVWNVMNDRNEYEKGRTVSYQTVVNEKSITHKIYRMLSARKGVYIYMHTVYGGKIFSSRKAPSTVR